MNKPPISVPTESRLIYYFRLLADPDVNLEFLRECAQKESSLLAVGRQLVPEKVCKECGTEVEAMRCSHVINDYGFIPDLCHLAYKHEGDHKWCRRCCLRFAGRCVECGSFPSMHLKDCPLASLPVGESRWISVEEKLPEDRKAVLVAHENLGNWVWVATRVSGQWKQSHNHDIEFNTGEITHWQPLPKPPELGLGESREPLQPKTEVGTQEKP